MGGALIFQKPSGVGSSGGTSNEPQRSVDLQGPSAEGQVVPNVIGLDIDSASKLIEEAGFAIGGLGFANSDDVRSQCVISQEVEAGQTLQEGISIDLTISNGPAKHEYAVVSGKKTWGEAKAYCEGKGGTLACINSQEKYDEVPEVAKAASRKVFWLGGYLNGDEFAWVDEEPVSFTAWAPGEPNNDLGIENRVALLDAEGTWGWYDVPNDFGETYPAEKLAFIMEVSK